MPWNDDVIDGNRSVSQNKTPLNQNSQYITTTQRVDHFWANGNANLDGHHQFVQMPKFDSPPFNPLVDIAADMDGAFYTEEITKEDLTTEVNAFYAEKANDQISYLGIRAAVNFSVSAQVPTIEWQHNVATVAFVSEGVYTITFTKAIPSRNYCFSGFAFRNNTPLYLAPDSGGIYSTIVNPGNVRVRFPDSNGNARNPTRASLIVIGG